MPPVSVGVRGQDHKLFVNSTDDPPVALEIEYQGDATYNDGKSQEKTITKNGSVPWRKDDGATISVNVIRHRPIPAGQQRLYDLAKSGDSGTFIYDDPNSGGLRREGVAQVTGSDESANTEGVVEVSYEIAFIGDPTETVNA